MFREFMTHQMPTVTEGFCRGETQGKGKTGGGGEGMRGKIHIPLKPRIFETPLQTTEPNSPNDLEVQLFFPPTLL